MVLGLLIGKTRNRWKYTKSIGREEDHRRGVPRPARQDRVRDVVDGVRGARVLGEARVGQVEALGHRVEHHVLEHGAEATRGREDLGLGDLVAEIDARKSLFLASKVWTRGADEGKAQMEATLAKLRVETLDLMQIHNLLDWKTQLKTLRDWKQKGRIRYLGLTHYRSEAYGELARLIKNEQIDFLQVNYSLAEPESARTLLPLAADRGVAVIVNRPFAGGQLFPRVRGMPLPGWASEFDCATWAQFFLKFILAQPAVTCVIPGTRRPHYMLDNARAGTGRLPDASMQSRMREYLQSL